MTSHPPEQNHVVAVLAWTLFLVAAAGVPSELVLQDTLKSAIVSVGTLTAATLFFWQSRHSDRPVRWHHIVWPPLALMAYALGSMVWSHAYLAGAEVLRWFMFSLLLWLSLNTLTPSTFPKLVWGIHWGASCAALWAALQFWFEFSWFPEFATPASTFGNRNFFAEYLVCTLPFSVLALASTLRAAPVLATALSLSLNVVAVLFSGTRSALLALVVIVAILAAVMTRFGKQLPYQTWPRQRRLGVAVLCLASVCVLGTLPSGNSKTLAERFGATPFQRSLNRSASIAEPAEYTQGSFSVRAHMWKATARMALDHPLAGVGAGAWEAEVPLYQDSEEWLETDFYAHNELLQLLSEYGGVVGGVCLAFLLAYLWIAARKSAALEALQDSEAATRAIALTSVLGLLLVCNAGFPLHLAACSALMAVCLGVLAASDQRIGTGEMFRAKALGMGSVQQYLALAVCLVCLVLTVDVSRRAMLAEYRIVSAIHLGNELLIAQKHSVAEDSARKAQMLDNARESLAINPNYRNFDAMVAEQFERLGDLPNALWVLESLAETRPNVASFRSGLAFTYSRLGQHDAAWRQLTELRRLRPTSIATDEVELVLLVNAKRTNEAKERLIAQFASGRYTLGMVEVGYEIGVRTADWQLAMTCLAQRSARWPQFAQDTALKLRQLHAALGK